MTRRPTRDALLAAAPASLRARNAPPAPAKRPGRSSARPATPDALTGALDAAARARGAGARPEASALHALAIRELQEALRMARAAGFLPRLAPLDQIDEQPGDSDRGKGL